MSLFRKKSFSIDEQRKEELQVVNEVSSSRAPLQLIQQSLVDIHIRLNKLDSVEQCIKDLKHDVWGTEGLDEKINYVAQQAEDCSSDLGAVKDENIKLRKEMELMKSVIIKLDRKVTEQNNEILNLKNRSMRDNVLIHNFKETDGEDLMKQVPAAIKSHLKVDVEFVRIHRNGSFPNKNGKPRTITGKLVDLSKKFEILKAQKARRDEKVQLPFSVTPQSPTEIVENRKKLFEISNRYNENKIKTRVVRDKLIYPDKSVYRDKVTKPKAEDILLTSEKEKEKLNQIEVSTSNEITESGNRFIANSTHVRTLNEVRRFYKKIVSIPAHAKAHHNILIYRYMDSENKLQEGYVDDDEFGAGRKTLRYLADNGLMNVAVVVTRWYSGIHIGPKRFEIIQKVAGQAADQVYQTC